MKKHEHQYFQVSAHKNTLTVKFDPVIERQLIMGRMHKELDAFFGRLYAIYNSAFIDEKTFSDVAALATTWLLEMVKAKKLVVPRPILFPIGTRVTHFGGGPSTHGKGTVVDYNSRPKNRYVEERPEEAVAMAAQSGLLDPLVDSFYDAGRCPYVVQWDFNPRYAEDYPQGYRDVYEHDSLQLLLEKE